MYLIRKMNLKLLKIINSKNYLIKRFQSQKNINEEKTRKNLKNLETFYNQKKKNFVPKAIKIEKKLDEKILSINKENQFKKLNEILLPYENIEYLKQINFKKQSLGLFLNQLVNKTTSLESTFVKGSDGFPCVINTISSKKINEYQFQNLFLINKDIDGKIAVGLNLGDFKNGLITIKPNNYNVCKATHQYLANSFEYYLKNISQFSVCLDYNSDFGNWISFLVRSNNKNEHQCILKLRKLNLKNQNIKQEKELIKQFFRSLNINIKSFYLEVVESDYDYETKKKKFSTKQHFIYGEKSLKFEFLGKSFDILPETLVPINTDAYENLFKNILEDLTSNKNQNLILINKFYHLFIPFLLENVKKLYVLENEKNENNLIEKSVIHKNNNTKNLMEIIDNSLEEISLICQPRDINLRIINDLRKDKYLKKIFFISTDLDEDLMKKIIFFCLTNKNKEILGKPFNLIRSTLVDTHPLTKKFTSIFFLERI